MLAVIGHSNCRVTLTVPGAIRVQSRTKQRFLNVLARTSETFAPGTSYSSLILYLFEVSFGLIRIEQNLCKTQ